MSKGRQIRICAALCALAALPAGARAEETRQDFPDNPRFTVQRFQDQEGMGAITATALGQDAQGFLWIGTQTGLYRYDGTRAKKMPEVESIIGHNVVCGNSRDRVLQGGPVSETGDASEFDAAVERGADLCRGQPGDCLRADVQARPVET